MFGRSPAGGYVPYEQVVGIYGRSRINLCLNNNVTGIDNIKGRNFEIPACRGFVISGPARGLEEFFDIGEEIIVYHLPDDVTNKILYYLQHDDERKAIAQAGYNRAIREHTYQRRFRDIFAHIGLELDRAGVSCRE